MYQVIARKYRPQTFPDVVNQDHVKRTLINALRRNRVGHGYIFSGQRGTGKTTMARLLAKALNCDQGPTAEPCLQCPSCLEVAAGNSLDLIEIDAASNRRIDDIRELRENVRYRPVRDRYKVFIIDEAHQITADAFNALLKTLEEPPEWVVFILCTTEPHEIPATIASRCQSFPFRAVDLDGVVERMQWICEQEGIEAEPDALVAMAVAGDGSIRDSLSTLDQAIACFGNKLETQAIRDLLGAVSSEITDQIVQALRDRDPSAMLAIADRVLREGRHVQQFCGELTRYFRNLMVMKVSGPDTRLVTVGPSERDKIHTYLEYFSSEDLTRYLQLLLVLYRDLQQAAQPRFRLEVGLLKLVYAGHLRPLEEVLAEWNEAGPADSGTGAPPSASGEPSNRARSAAKKSGAAQDSRPPETAPAMVSAASAGAGEATQERAVPASAAAEPPTEAQPRRRGDGSKTAADLRQQLVDALQRQGDEHLADAVEHGLVERSGQHIEIRSLADYQTALRLDLDTLQKALEEIIGGGVRVTLGSPLGPTDLASNGSPTSPSGSVSEAAASQEQVAPPGEAAQEATRRALEDPEVQKFQKLFPGRIRQVRNLRGYSS